MGYRWDDFSLDRDAMLLIHRGRQVDLSRKTLECIHHLVENRHRVVGYDELIRVLWGHDSVTNHQLSQVILSARRVLGDDGHAQRVIRTMAGQGYHWAAAVVETGDTAATDTLQSRAGSGGEAQASLPAPQPAVGATSSDRPTSLALSPADHADDVPAKHGGPVPALPARPDTLPGSTIRARWFLPTTVTACVAAIVAVVVAVDLHQVEPTPSATRATAATGEPALESLRGLLLMGRYDEARDALAALPTPLAERREARLIAIDLDIQRGRFDRGSDRLDAEFRSADAAANPGFQVELLLRRSTLNSRQQAPGAEVFAPADAAVALLRAQPKDVPPELMAEALRVRANGYNLTDRPDDALRDLAEALDIHEREGDAHRVAIVRASRARTWMRMGRMADAQEELGEAAEVFRALDDKLSEVLARNTLAKIQIESLRWRDAAASTDRAMRLVREMQDSDRRYPTMQLRAMALIGLGRLREAASLLDEAEASNSQRRNGIVQAMHRLEAGQPIAALDIAARDFHGSRIDTRSNLVLENREGALLLWVMAAQALDERGEPPPVPSAAQRTLLESPTNPVARIARGRWLLLQGEEQSAEHQLRLSLQEAQSLNQRLRMLLAAEPLVEIALRKADVASARQVIDDLHGYDPDAMDGDYRFGVLRLQVALRGEDFSAIETAYRKARALAGERMLPKRLDRLYVERRDHGAGPAWAGGATPGAR